MGASYPTGKRPGIEYPGIRRRGKYDLHTDKYGYKMHYHLGMRHNEEDVAIYKWNYLDDPTCATWVLLKENEEWWVYDIKMNKVYDIL